MVELVPDRSNGSWFENACRSGIRCDVLLVSGHFGALFFGESKSNILELDRLEKASCERSCPGLLEHPKEVFLMGCNTLANHTRDHRSLEQYLDVLLYDGFPLGLAEEVAVARYGGEGLSLEDRFGIVFGSQTSIYGFGSTGPIGKRAAPVLERYLRSIPNYSLHLANKEASRENGRLKSAFGKTSFKELLQPNRLNRFDKSLVCALKSSQQHTVQEGLSKIESMGKSRQFLDRIREALLRTEFQTSERLANKSLEGINTELQASLKRTKQLFEVALQNLYALMKVEEMNGQAAVASQLRKKIQDEVDKRILKTRDAKEASRICEVARRDSSLILRDEILAKMPASEDLRVYVRDCFKNKAPNITPSSLTSIPEAEVQFRSCLQNVSRNSTSHQRDGTRWGCWNNLKPSSEQACIAVTEAMETNAAKDIAWQCVNRQDPSIAACLTSARALLLAGGSAGEQAHDDALWTCYERKLYRLNLTSGQCLTLQREMRIPGHRIKMQWNCLNRVP